MSDVEAGAGQGHSVMDKRKADGGGVVSVLASLKFALVILLLIAAACVVGTLLPQGAEVAKFLQKNPAAQARMELFNVLGLTRVFSCWWFILLLCLLALSLSACTYRRFKVLIRRSGGLRWKDIGSLFTHVSLLLILLGGVVRGVWGQTGYLPFSEGETKGSFYIDNVLNELPFDVFLQKFEIEYYESDVSSNAVAERLLVFDDGILKSELPVEIDRQHILGQVNIRVIRKVLDFVVDMETREVTSRSDEPRNPAILLESVTGSVTNRQWLFALHPEFNQHFAAEEGKAIPYVFGYEMSLPPPPMVKDYKSTLHILDAGILVKKKTIEVNSPLSYKGYTFYQSGYNPEDPKWTSLQVVKDPGVPLVYLGFVLMIAGMALVFYVNPALGITGAVDK